MRVDRGEMQLQELAEGPRPFRALYEHWERHQWSPFAIDFSTDAASFKALADAQLDPVAAALYAALEGVVRALEASRDEDSFLKAIVAYHLIAEGSIGRANQNFVAAQFDRIGLFPGLREAQRLAVRDEVRHIGIGVSYVRRRLTADGVHARALIEEIVEGFQALGDSLLEAAAPDVLDDFARAYGAEPATLWAEVLHQLRLRLRSIGFSPAGRKSRIALRP
jgi:ribonucleotide reductase beta subunit family protein with ferritin-like domain